jgi:uncharacterized protein (DUF736 family)
MSKTMTQVGVAWKKKTQQSGKEFLSVLLPNATGPDIRLTMWTNSYKEKDGQPDYIVYKSADPRPAAKPAEGSESSDYPDEGAPNDVPF